MENKADIYLEGVITGVILSILICWFMWLVMR